jgi:hypothetical protein
MLDDLAQHSVGYFAGYGVAMLLVAFWPTPHPIASAAIAFSAWIGCIILRAVRGKRNKCHG